MENLHLLFNKSIYDNITLDEKKGPKIPDLEEKNRRLFNAKFYEQDYKKCEISDDVVLIYAKTCYPGLLIGSGNVHGVSVENDIQIGFTFDYVTGQPYIPGSSVKGIIKSYFKKPGVVNSILNKEFSEKQIKDLVESIFEDGEDNDIFLDAVIKHGNSDGLIMGKDYLAPHSGPTKEPVPLMFVKVIPDVVFEFRFILKDSKVDGEVVLSVADKKKLFSEIIETFGVGAKTNVGYGSMKVIDADSTEIKDYVYPSFRAEDIPTEPVLPRRENSQNRQNNRSNNQPNRNSQSSDLKVGNIVKCKITSIKNFGAFVKIIETGESGLIHISEIANKRINSVEEYLHVGDETDAKIIRVDEKGISLSIKKLH